MTNVVLNNYCPHRLLFFKTSYSLKISFGLCVLGDTERRVALYDMEKDALEEDDPSNYKWDGERLPVVLRIFDWGAGKSLY